MKKKRKMKQNKNSKVLAITLMVLLLVSLVGNVALFLTKNKVKKELVLSEEKIQQLKAELNKTKTKLDSVPCWNEVCKATLNTEYDDLSNSVITVYKYKGKIATEAVMEYTGYANNFVINMMKQMTKKLVKTLKKTPHKEFGEEAVFVRVVVNDEYGNTITEYSEGIKPKWFN